MVYGVDETTGEPGKRLPVGGGATKEYVDYAAEAAALAAVSDHTLNPDPHPQYGGGGGGGAINLDGGGPSSVYGGTDPLDGGSP